MHPIFQLQGCVTQFVFYLQLCNLTAGCSYHCSAGYMMREYVTGPAM